MERNKVAKENQYFSEDMETMSIADIEKLQIEKTRETLERAYHKSDFYRQRFDRAKVKPQVTMKFEAVPHGTLPRFEYKVRRWTDERVEGLERVKYIEKN
jgi:phenylacetate-coenzyme A ligase PaaK-like adenylate-forming protein